MNNSIKYSVGLFSRYYMLTWALVLMLVSIANDSHSAEKNSNSYFNSKADCKLNTENKINKLIRQKFQLYQRLKNSPGGMFNGALHVSYCLDRIHRVNNQIKSLNKRCDVYDFIYGKLLVSEVTLLLDEATSR